MSCPFCFNNRKKFLANNYYNVEKMYFFEDEHFSISPDLAPLVIGHLLIIPKRHFASFGEINENDIINKMKSISQKLLGSNDLLYFEHGAVIEGEGGGSVDHAHLHVMPRPIDFNISSIDYYIKSSGYVKSEKIRASHSVSQSMFFSKQPYIFYELLGEKYAYSVNNLPHQFLRIMLQKYCPFNYNWRKTYDSEECRNSVKKTIEYVNKQGSQVICL